MKLLMCLGILFSIITSNASAFDCGAARVELLAIEDKILNSKFAICGSDGAYSEPHCCNPSKPNTCKTRRELETEYNTAVAKLVLAEGILALGLAIESNYSAFKLQSKKLDEATEYVEKLDQSLMQADLLYAAIDLNDDSEESLWRDYNGSTPDEVAAYVNTLCSDQKHSQKRFCLEYEKLQTNENLPAGTMADQIDMLNGFLNADNQASPTQLDKDSLMRQRYNVYRENLMILVDTADSDKKLTPQEFRQSSVYAKVKLIQSHLLRYRALEVDGKIEEKNKVAKEILELANELDPIDLDYTTTLPPQGTSLGGTTKTAREVLSQKFDNVLAQMNLPDLILNSSAESNFKNNINLLEKDIARLGRGSAKKIQKVLQDNKNRSIGDGKTIGELCKNNFDIDCYRNLCQNDRCLNSELAELGLSDFKLEIDLLDNQKDALSQAKQAQACLSSERTTKEKQDCVRSVAKDLANISESDIEKLRQEVKFFDQMIGRQDQVEPFKTLNIEKALTLEVVNARKCVKNKSENISISCGGNDVVGTSTINQQYLNLADDGEEILIKLNHRLTHQALSEQGVTGVNSENKSAFLAKCRKDETDKSAVCVNLREEKAHEEKLAEARKRELARQQERKIRRREIALEDEEESVGSYLLEGFAQTAPMYITPLVYSWAERRQVKEETSSQIASIKAYDNWYMNSYKPSWEQYYSDLSSGSVTNWGYDFSQAYTFESATSFQSNNVSNLYSTNTGVQTSFTPIPTTITTNGSIQSTTKSSTGSSNFSFGF